MLFYTLLSVIQFTGGVSAWCHFFLATWSHVPFLPEVSVSGSMFLRGVSVPQRTPGQRTPLNREPLDRDPLDRVQHFGQRPPWTETSFLDRDPLDRDPPCTAKSRWYASYWNTFLFFKYFIGYFLNKLNFLNVWLSKKQFKWLQPKLSLVSSATILQTAKFLLRRNLDPRYFLESKWLIIWLLE